MAGKVESYAAVNNVLINAYWEANLPRNYQKPGPNASGHEVTSFLTDKYVNKRWVDKDMKHDPMYLFENKRSRFDKFVKRHYQQEGSGSEEESDQDAKPKKKDTKPAAASSAKQAPRAPPRAAQPVKQPPAMTKDLINLTPATD